jgi:hypothetical protein
MRVRMLWTEPVLIMISVAFKIQNLFRVLQRGIIVNVTVNLLK